MGKSEEFPELSDTNWLCDFAFAVDIFSHMNELNVKLQGKDQFAHDMYTNVRAFKSKLVLFSRQMSNKSFAHFPTLAVQKEAARNAKKYCKSLDDLHREFCRRFCDFEKIDKSLQLVSCPLSQDPESAPQELQLELIDLQSDSVSKEKFKSLKLNDFYASLNETAFPNLRRTAQKMLVLFGSTYVCEQTFSKWFLCVLLCLWGNINSGVLPLTPMFSASPVTPDETPLHHCRTNKECLSTARLSPCHLSPFCITAPGAVAPDVRDTSEAPEEETSATVEE
ncbi:hypothetical protein NHX12_026853 [Muraenolepis orangiensis]|uniref:General transcription factor II-I repeat domain-containing protein 2 n=1 Tax=Muraenolepis orangiensis TaxID=630683 RepID=A0A9Q0EFK5_9TELE|nr:hypothetical protein NHX12_026853 [Muraenolepis orangiensis]